MITGLRIVESQLLPIQPSPGEDARRIVRHGLADVLFWLGENPGPGPGVATEAVRIGDEVHVSARMADVLRGRADADRR